MPPLELEERRHFAVLWEFQGKYDSAGQAKVVDAPREIRVRWNDVLRESTDRDGNTIIYSATVICGENLTPGSVLWKGKLGDLPDGTALDDSDGPFHQVVSSNATSDLKGRATRFEVTLMRFRGNLPNLVH